MNLSLRRVKKPEELVPVQWMESRDEVTEVSKPRNQAAIFKENKL